MCYENIELLYIDINNLRRWVLSQKFSRVDYKEDFDKIQHNIDNLPEESEIVYILEVDITTPIEFHIGLDQVAGVLARDTIHYALLKYNLELGVRVTKIYRIISFSQYFMLV